MTIRVNDNADAIRYGHATDAGNEAVLVNLSRADANRIGVTDNPGIADIDIVVASGEAYPGRVTHGDLFFPLTLATSVNTPMAVLRPSVVLFWSAPTPSATFSIPIVLLVSAEKRRVQS